MPNTAEHIDQTEGIPKTQAHHLQIVSEMKLELVNAFEQLDVQQLQALKTHIHHELNTRPHLLANREYLYGFLISTIKPLNFIHKDDTVSRYIFKIATLHAQDEITSKQGVQMLISLIGGLDFLEINKPSQQDLTNLDS